MRRTVRDRDRDAAHTARPWPERPGAEGAKSGKHVDDLPEEANLSAELLRRGHASRAPLDEAERPGRRCGGEQRGDEVDEVAGEQTVVAAGGGGGASGQLDQGEPDPRVAR